MAAGTTVYRSFKPNVTTYTNVLATTTPPVTQLTVLPGVASDATTTVYFAAGQYIYQYAMQSPARPCSRAPTASESYPR